MKKDLIISSIMIISLISIITFISLYKNEHFVYNIRNIFPDSNSYQVSNAILIIPEDIVNIEQKIEQLKTLGPNKYYIMIPATSNIDLLDLVENKTILYEFNINEFYLYDIPEWQNGTYSRSGVLVLDITEDKCIATTKLPNDDIDNYDHAGPAAIKFKLKGDI